LDGCNVGIHIYPDGDVRYSKRSGFLSEDESFYGWQDAVKNDVQLNELIEKRSEEAALTGHAFTLHGELFGPCIQKRVDYGPVRRVLFYGVDIDDYPQPGQVFLDVIPEQHRVPVLGLAAGFEIALARVNTFPSMLNPVEGNTCEGITFMPLSVCPVNANGEAFWVKSKNEGFTEIMKHPPKVKSELPEELCALSALARSMVTESRLCSVMSKRDAPAHAKEFGDVMRDMMSDVASEMQEHMQELSQADAKRCLSDANKDASELIRARFRSLGLP